MSDTADVAEPRDNKGRFLPGNSGNGGRKPGARNKLGEAFIEDLRDAWEECGADALRRCAEEEPGTFCKIIAGLLPKTIDLNVGVINPADFADRFRAAAALLGHEIEPPRLRRTLRGEPLTIEHEGNHDG